MPFYCSWCESSERFTLNVLSLLSEFCLFQITSQELMHRSLLGNWIFNSVINSDFLPLLFWSCRLLWKLKEVQWNFPSQLKHWGDFVSDSYYCSYIYAIDELSVWLEFVIKKKSVQIWLLLSIACIVYDGKLVVGEVTFL